jgi:hypothetical protein
MIASSSEEIASTIRNTLGIEKVPGEVCYGTVTAVMVGCFGRYVIETSKV